MKQRLFLLAGLLFLSMSAATAQSPIGIWKTIDDETGEEKSYVEIYEEGGKLYGKIVKLLQVAEDTTCDECPGDKKDQPLMGMQVVWDLEPYKDYWSYGRIMDPNNGKTYKCSIWLKEDDQLEVRGYMGVSALGRTQSWYRIR
jgi:uncharacterized protein (DUF2147 family)